MSEKTLEHVSNYSELHCKIFSKKHQLCIVLFDLSDTKAGKQMTEYILDFVVEGDVSISYMKIDVKEVPECTSQYNIVGVPTLITFFRGKEVDRIVGLRNKEIIYQNLAKSVKEAMSAKSEYETRVITTDKDMQSCLQCAKDSLLLVDFYANWCMPCRILAPVIEEAVTERIDAGDNVELVKVDVSTNDDLAVQYKVDVLPTVIAFNQLKEIERFDGLREKDGIFSFIQECLHNMENGKGDNPK